ncbi:MAG: NACHT domain-containing protein [Coleofasciculaceae cyanobacterium]
MRQEAEDVEIRLRRLTPQQVKNRQAILNKVREFWVEGVLETSLHKQVLSEQGLEEHADGVVSLNLELATADETQKPLPKGTKVISIFDQLSEGQTLLILGEAGSGKTTTLLELTRDLLSRAEQGLDYRIPVVLNLSSWVGGKQTIADWLVVELSSTYQVPQSIVGDWLQREELLLLLDDLDEVKAEQRDSCVAALNDFYQNHEHPMVVCSCIKDDEEVSNRLNFQSAIYLKPFTIEQVSHYLDSIQADLTGLRALMAENTTLQELAKSPLIINMMVLAYQGLSVEDLPKTEALEEGRKQLFDDYIERMFRRPTRLKIILAGFVYYVANSNLIGTKHPYSEVQSRRWLTWLAQRMVQESQTVFFTEEMHTWLQSKRERILYGLGGGVLIGLSLALGLWLLYGLLINGVMGLIQGLPIGKLSYWLVSELIRLLTYGFIGGLIFGLIESIFGKQQICIQQFLRLILYRQGYIPRTHSFFLDYAAERIFLQKVGGGYIFIHRLLLEHFAQMKLEN